MSTATPAQPATPPSAAPAAPVDSPATPPAAAPAAPPAATAPATPGTPQAAVGGTEPPAPPTPPATPPEPVVLKDVKELVVPEGFPAEDATAIAALAQQHQWTKEEAQAALDAAHAHVVEQRAAMSARLQTHPEVGGERTAAAQAAAIRALDRFLPATTPEGIEFRKYMNATGLGNWPPAVVLLSRIGQAMGEDGMVVRDSTMTPAVVDPVQRLYGTKPT